MLTRFDIDKIIRRGELIDCDVEEYPDVRKMIQDLAGEYIDEHQTPHFVIAMNEVKRLDARFRFKLNPLG